MTEQGHIFGNCEACGALLRGTTLKELILAVDEHNLTCPGAKPPPPPGDKVARPITEMVPPEVLRGTLVGMDEVLDKLLLVKDYRFRESAYKEDTEYLSLTVDLDGEERIVNTGAERVVLFFKYLKPEDLPVFVTFEKALTKQGRRVYRVKA